jgi:cell wall-associated NlpC family hydrolase
MRQFLGKIIVLMMISGCSGGDSGIQKATCVEQHATFLQLKEVSNLPQSARALISVFSLKKGGPALGDYGSLAHEWRGAWRTKALSMDRKKLKEWVDSLPIEKWYSENLHLAQKERLHRIKGNTNIGAINSIAQPGIMVEHANLRLLPTDYPLYKPVSEAFFGAPFDRLQNSYLHAGTAVYISHWTKDRAWALIEDGSSHASGFVKSNQVALMDDAALRRVNPLPIAVCLKDNHPLYDEQGLFLAHTRLGSVLFVEKQDDKNMHVLWPQRNDKGMACWKKVRIAQNVASTTPLVWNHQNLVSVLEQLLGKPYGWGGLFGNRDCSAMVQDYFRVFGINLPRNSKGQIEKKKGVFIDLSSLSNEEKEQKVIREGVPYRTILYRPGHIGIYVGCLKGRAIMIHAVWEVNLHSTEGKFRRNVIGKAIASHLDYGKELPGVLMDKLFLTRLSGMRTF